MSAPTVASGRELARRLGALQRDHPLAQIVALVGLFSYGSETLGSFTSSFSLKSMLLLGSLLGISALGQTLCVLVGGLDVSVAGWILAGATTTVELLGGTGTHWQVWELFLFLGVGSLVGGGLTGWICHRYAVPPIVLTLATGSMVTGGVLAWKHGFIDASAPSWLARVSSASGTTFGVGVPAVVFVWLIVVVVASLILHRTVVGAWIYATGNNPRAADLALVPTAAVWAGAYAISAFSATTAGVFLAGFAFAGDSSVGEPYLWNGITAVIVGGTAFGARGGYLRTVLGTLLLIVLAQVMIGNGYSYADQQILYGALILLVVGLYGRDRRLRDQV
jgi:ribose transport system permease protein